MYKSSLGGLQQQQLLNYARAHTRHMCVCVDEVGLQKIELLLGISVDANVIGVSLDIIYSW